MFRDSSRRTAFDSNRVKCSTIPSTINHAASWGMKMHLDVQSQFMQDFRSYNRQQFGLQNSENFNSTYVQRFDSSEEQQRSLKYQENQWLQMQRFSFSGRYNMNSTQRVDSSTFRTSRLDSSESSWNQHVGHLSWASGAMQQSARSSNSIDEFGRDAIENYLFY